ncbi:unnamed protein product [Rotaria sp. Silwood2]|nr:unnamed protein product [Rotaria sp. Silwood2]CAF4475352.1 unnamed protein product [Rotaria sp. Silwood2]
MSLCLKLRLITSSRNRLLSTAQSLCYLNVHGGDLLLFECSSKNPICCISGRTFSQYKFPQQQEQQRSLLQQMTEKDKLEEKVRQMQQQKEEFKKKLRILFLTNAHNSMSQAAYLMLTEMGHIVMVELALSSEQMEQIATELKPELIICPFLTKVVPESLHTKFKTMIVHPDIVGDRGIHSLDWALMEGQKEWGVTVMEAATEMDSGPIFATENFPLDTLLPSELTKSKVYRNQVVPAALKAIQRAVINFIEQIEPIPLDYSDPSIKGTLKPTMKQSQCAINWEEDDARTVIRKISSRDSNPGLLDSVLFGERMYLYGAHIENLITIPPNTPSKQLLGQRDSAILVSCNGGKEAVWITHMKRATNNSFKLPSTMLLESDRLGTLPILATNFTTIPTNTTFNEVYYEQKGNVVYLHFTFYNGAMSTAQCQRLLQALHEITQIDSAKVIILCGGSTYFSNGIHLNVIEAAKNQYNESWANINAMNDIILKIMSITNKLTISALQGSAGAGGVMLTLAADYIYATAKTILNPHYRTMGLFGSEYWTYNLPRRIGYTYAREITEACQPILPKKAKEIRLINGVLTETGNEMLEKIHDIANLLLSSHKYDNLIKNKQKKCGTLFYDKLAACRSTELAKMTENFQSAAYRTARHAFVHKLSPFITPWHIKRLGRNRAIRVDGNKISSYFQTKIGLEIKSLHASVIEAGLPRRLPGLACLLVGSRRDSLLYVQKKAILAASLGFFSQIVEIKDNEGKNSSELQDTIIKQIKQWNDDPLIDGILVQLPLPK